MLRRARVPLATLWRYLREGVLMQEKPFKPLKFPLHSLVVHIPVGLWSAALLFDLLNRLHAGGNTTVRLSFWSIALGLAGALVAVPTGVLDWGGVKKEKPAWKI